MNGPIRRIWPTRHPTGAVSRRLQFDWLNLGDPDYVALRNIKLAEMSIERIELYANVSFKRAGSHVHEVSRSCHHL